MSKSVKFKFFNNKNGKSKGIYSSLNCGLKSQDNLQNVKKNIEIAKITEDYPNRKFCFFDIKCFK